MDLPDLCLQGKLMRRKDSDFHRAAPCTHPGTGTFSTGFHVVINRGWDYTPCGDPSFNHEVILKVKFCECGATSIEWNGEIIIVLIS